MPNAAFDALAPTYDVDFTESPIARHLRGRVQRRLARYFAAGHHVLELGCGTGVDARFLAQRGVRVTATDASPQMLAQTRAKITQYQPSLVTTALLDINRLESSDLPAVFDGVYANFGVLNAVRDIEQLASWLHSRVCPGGIVVFVVMSPLCLWELTWHTLHGNWQTATRRQRQSTTFVTDTGVLPLNYPMPHSLRGVFNRHGFRAVEVAPLGVMLPTSDAYGVIEKRSRLMRFLLQLDQPLESIPPLAAFADHYLIALRHIHA